MYLECFKVCTRNLGFHLYLGPDQYGACLRLGRTLINIILWEDPEMLPF